MFLGEYKETIDEKGRLLLPILFSVELESGMVLTRGFERNLMLFPHEGWQQLAQKVLSQPLSHQQSRALRRRLFSNAAVLTLDPFGRIRLPAVLSDFAALEGDVRLVGMFDYFEIWNTRIWSPFQEAANNGSNASIWESIGV